MGFATREAVQRAKAAGCDGLVVNSPCYVRPSPAAFAEYVRAMTEASGLNAVVYSSTSLAMDEPYLEAFVDVDGFRGVVDELSSPEEFARRVAQWGDRVDFRVVGEYNAAPYLAAGAKTVTSALANVCPEASHEHLEGRDQTGEPANMVARPGPSASAPKVMIAALTPRPTAVRAPQATASATLKRACPRA
ncbi:dihydrodipicolinate synthase family protein [Rhodococcus jostii]|uniref:dihydrodipicolinate synthase family protein n=1 Tax=Rhodococcus jostii TaxID=132919 RepID=UPI0009338A44|nr:dihydrodipicolinate synthase family protein [Rhodococcus jostii]